MVRIKTKYKAKAYRDGGAVPLDVQIDTRAAHIAADSLTEQMLPAVEAMETPVDEASVAFQKQIDELRKAEGLQRQRVAEEAASLPLTPRQAAFVEANPGFIREPEVALQSIVKAHQQGHAPDTDEFHKAVKANFEAEMHRRHDPAPAFEPPPPSVSHRSAMVSAPVSRAVPDGRSYSERSESRVTLSAEEKDMARRSGITEREYAEGKLRMLQEKRDGIRQ